MPSGRLVRCWRRHSLDEHGCIEPYALRSQPIQPDRNHAKQWRAFRRLGFGNSTRTRRSILPRHMRQRRTLAVHNSGFRYKHRQRQRQKRRCRPWRKTAPRVHGPLPFPCALDYWERWNSLPYTAALSVRTTIFSAIHRPFLASLDCTTELLFPMCHFHCFEAGRFTQIQSSWTALCCSRKWMSGHADALAEPKMDRFRKIQAPLPCSRR